MVGSFVQLLRSLAEGGRFDPDDGHLQWMGWRDFSDSNCEVEPSQMGDLSPPTSELETGTRPLEWGVQATWWADYSPHVVAGPLSKISGWDASDAGLYD